MFFIPERRLHWDFPSGPVVKTVLPLQGAWVQSLVQELRFHKPHGVAKKKANSLTDLITLSINSIFVLQRHFSTICVFLLVFIGVL